MKKVDYNKLTPELEQLFNIAERPVFDGNLICKKTRDMLYDKGYIDRMHGFNFITREGFNLLYELGYVKAS